MTKSKLSLLISSSVLALVLVYFYSGVSIESKISTSCIPGNPISITVNNYSFRTVRNVHLKFHLYKEGISDNKLEAPNVIFNRIVKPFSNTSLCYGNDYTKTNTGYNQSQKLDMGNILDGIRATAEFKKSHEVYVDVKSINYID